MTRWEPGTIDRLYVAALDLFATNGYSTTTVDDIAARAGVTARTFHRHFADKEEVLFFRDAAMELVLVEATERLYAADGGTGDPYPSALGALRELAASFDAERPLLATRQRLLRAEPRLLGRQLAKQHGWQLAMVAALARHGVDHRVAALAVGRAALVTQLAFDEWVDGDETPLPAIIDAYDRLVRSAP